MFGAIGKAAGGLLGLGSKAVGGDYAQKRFDTRDVGIDPLAQDIMGRQTQRANMSTEDIQGEMLQGVQEPSREMAMQTGPGLSSITNNADLSRALSRRAERGATSDFERIKRRSEVTAEKQKAAQVQAAMQSQEQQRALDLQNFQRRQQAFMAQQSIKAQVMQNLFGTVGSFAGGAVGGMGRGQKPAAAPAGDWAVNYNANNNFGSTVA